MCGGESRLFMRVCPTSQLLSLHGLVSFRWICACLAARYASWMPFIWVFGKASQCLPQGHTFPRDWTHVTANSAANKHDDMLYVGSAETRHTNPSFMELYIYCCLSWFLNIFCFFQHSKHSKMSISIILDFRLSCSCSIMKLGDSILMVTSVGWEMLHQTAEVEMWGWRFGECTW